jgi:hypothetical protein
VLDRPGGGGEVGWLEGLDGNDASSIMVVLLSTRPRGPLKSGEGGGSEE